MVVSSDGMAWVRAAAGGSWCYRSVRCGDHRDGPMSAPGRTIAVGRGDGPSGATGGTVSFGVHRDPLTSDGLVPAGVDHDVLPLLCRFVTGNEPRLVSVHGHASSKCRLYGYGGQESETGAAWPVDPSGQRKPSYLWANSPPAAGAGGPK